MKKLVLTAVLCSLSGIAARAQNSGNPNQELTKEHMSIETEETSDTSVAVAAGLPTQKGSSFLGCNILLAQLDATAFDENQSMHYSVGASPRYGYFLANNFAIGAEINGNIDGYTKINQYIINTGVEAFARIYTGKAANKKGDINKLRFFVEGGIGYGYMFQRYGDASTGSSSSGSIDVGVLQAHLMPGLDYFANRNVAFELGLDYGYQHSVYNQDNMKDDHNRLALSIGMQVFFVKR